MSNLTSTVKEKKRKALEAKRAIRESRDKEARNLRYLMTVAYDGSKYGGYAKQKHKNTVQNVLEVTLQRYFGVVIKTTEASRTDSKVHALCQKVMFDVGEKLVVGKVRGQLNELLPKDIVVVDFEHVDSDFHCRYAVVNKTYEYVIRRDFDVRARNYAWYVGRELNIRKMQEASRCLIGEHDFVTFKSAKATTDGSVRTIHFLDILEREQEVLIRINADGFLYNMVRLIVKALVDVGMGVEDVDYVEGLLNLQRKPSNLASAPAQGLCLVEINYD